MPISEESFELIRLKEQLQAEIKPQRLFLNQCEPGVLIADDYFFWSFVVSYRDRNLFYITALTEFIEFFPPRVRHVGYRYETDIELINRGVWNWITGEQLERIKAYHAQLGPLKVR